MRSTSICAPSLPRCTAVTVSAVACSYGALFVWLYVLIWFVGQDVCKVLTYGFMSSFRKEEDSEFGLRVAQGSMHAMIDADDKSRAQRAGTHGARRQCTCMLSRSVAPALVSCAPSGPACLSRVLHPPVVSAASHD